MKPQEPLHFTDNELRYLEKLVNDDFKSTSPRARFFKIKDNVQNKIFSEIRKRIKDE